MSGVGAVFSALLIGCGQATSETDAISAEPTPAAAEAVVAETPAPEPTSVVTPSEPVQTDEVRQADSHVHGAADLAIALDEDLLFVEFDSPLYSVLGFEHAPKTDAQTQAVMSAQALLADPVALLRFNPEAGCVAAEARPVDLMGGLESEGHDHGDEHDHSHDDGHHDDHDHDHDHEDDHHDEHDHESQKDDESDAHNHRDITVTYSFTCQAPDRLQWVETELFGQFATLAEIDLVYLGPAKQMSAELTPGSGRIQLVD